MQAMFRTAHIFRSFCAPLLALALALPAAALAQSQDDLLQGSLLPGWQLENGHRMTALHLQLAPHWKTYWRAPGEAGIPPQFDWTGSQNLEKVVLHWPSPEVISLNGMQSIGYLDELVLPMELIPVDPDKPMQLQLNMVLGICEDICLPARLDLAMGLDGPGAGDARINAALARAPLTADQAGVGSVSCEALPIDDGLHLKAHVALPRQGETETMVFEVADPAVWVAEASSSRAGSVLTGGSDLVSESAAPFALDRSTVTITVIGQDRSVEIKGCPAS